MTNLVLSFCEACRTGTTPLFHARIVKWERQIIKHIMFITHVKCNAWLRTTPSKRNKVKSGPQERHPQIVLTQTDVPCNTLQHLPRRGTLLRNTSEIGFVFFSRYSNIASMASTESQGKRKFYQKEHIIFALVPHKMGCYHHLLEFHFFPIFLQYLQRLNWFSKHGFIFFLIKYWVILMKNLVCF